MRNFDDSVMQLLAKKILQRCPICHRPVNGWDITILGKDEDVVPQIWTVRYDCLDCHKIWQTNIEVHIRYHTLDRPENDSAV